MRGLGQNQSKSVHRLIILSVLGCIMQSLFPILSPSPLLPCGTNSLGVLHPSPQNRVQLRGASRLRGWGASTTEGTVAPGGIEASRLRGFDFFGSYHWSGFVVLVAPLLFKAIECSRILVATAFEFCAHMANFSNSRSGVRVVFASESKDDGWWQVQKWTQRVVEPIEAKRGWWSKQHRNEDDGRRKCADCGKEERGRAAYGKHYCYECWDRYRSDRDAEAWQDDRTSERTSKSRGTATAAEASISESGACGPHLSTVDERSDSTMEQAFPVVTDVAIEDGDNDLTPTEGGDKDLQEASVKGKAKPRRPPPRLWCQLLLHKQHPGFDLIPMLIGRGGCNMRDIHVATKAKVRIRGRGSGYFEVDGKVKPQFR